MRFRTTTSDARQPLFDHELVPREQVDEFVLIDDSDFGRGERRFIVLDGMVVTRRRHRILRDFALRNEQESPTVTLRFCLEGEVRAVMPEGEIRTGPRQHNIVYTPELAFDHLMRENSVHDVVEVYFSEEYLTSLIERYPELLEAPLASITRHRPFRLHDGGLGIPPPLLRTIHDLVDDQAYGPVRRMFIEAKGTELLAMQIQQRLEVDEMKLRADRISRGAADRVIEARDRVLARMADPPTLAELAREVGTNEFALKRDFKAFFGKPVYKMLLDYKMEYARALILDTDRPIGAIAHEIGYSHPAHFSTAFKKRFGCSPSSLRRR